MAMTHSMRYLRLKNRNKTMSELVEVKEDPDDLDNPFASPDTVTKVRNLIDSFDKVRIEKIDRIRVGLSDRYESFCELLKIQERENPKEIRDMMEFRSYIDTVVQNNFYEMLDAEVSMLKRLLFTMNQTFQIGVQSKLTKGADDMKRFKERYEEKANKLRRAALVEQNNQLATQKFQFEKKAAKTSEEHNEMVNGIRTFYETEIKSLKDNMDMKIREGIQEYIEELEAEKRRKEGGGKPGDKKREQTFKMKTEMLEDLKEEYGLLEEQLDASEEKVVKLEKELDVIKREKIRLEVSAKETKAHNEELEEKMEEAVVEQEMLRDKLTQAQQSYAEAKTMVANTESMVEKMRVEMTGQILEAQEKVKEQCEEAAQTKLQQVEAKWKDRIDTKDTEISLLRDQLDDVIKMRESLKEQLMTERERSDNFEAEANRAALQVKELEEVGATLSAAAANVAVKPPETTTHPLSKRKESIASVISDISAPAQSARASTAVVDDTTAESPRSEEEAEDTVPGGEVQARLTSAPIEIEFAAIQEPEVDLSAISSRASSVSSKAGRASGKVTASMQRMIDKLKSDNRNLEVELSASKEKEKELSERLRKLDTALYHMNKGSGDQSRKLDELKKLCNALKAELDYQWKLPKATRSIDSIQAELKEQMETKLKVLIDYHMNIHEPTAMSRSLAGLTDNSADNRCLSCGCPQPGSSAYGALHKEVKNVESNFVVNASGTQGTVEASPSKQNLVDRPLSASYSVIGKDGNAYWGGVESLDIDSMTENIASKSLDDARVPRQAGGAVKQSSRDTRHRSPNSPPRPFRRSVDSPFKRSTSILSPVKMASSAEKPFARLSKYLNPGEELRVSLRVPIIRHLSKSAWTLFRNDDKRAIQLSEDADLNINLDTRITSIMESPDFLLYVDRMWNVVAKDSHNRLLQKSFFYLNTLIYEVLIERFDPEEAFQAAEEDWGDDSRRGYISYEKFIKSMFRLADNWVGSLQPEEYGEFLSKLLDRIATETFPPALKTNMKAKLVAAKVHESEVQRPSSAFTKANKTESLEPVRRPGSAGNAYRSASVAKLHFLEGTNDHDWSLNRSGVMPGSGGKDKSNPWKSTNTSLPLMGSEKKKRKPVQAVGFLRDEKENKAQPQGQRRGTVDVVTKPERFNSKDILTPGKAQQSRPRSASLRE